jgi:hypothetical protein
MGLNQRPTPLDQSKYGPVCATRDDLWWRWNNDFRAANSETDFHVETRCAGDPMYCPPGNFPIPKLKEDLKTRDTHTARRSAMALELFIIVPSVAMADAPTPRPLPVIVVMPVMAISRAVFVSPMTMVAGSRDTKRSIHTSNRPTDCTANDTTHWTSGSITFRRAALHSTKNALSMSGHRRG